MYLVSGRYAWWSTVLLVVNCFSASNHGQERNVGKVFTHLTESPFSMIILLNEYFVILASVFYLVVSFSLGNLRAIEKQTIKETIVDSTIVGVLYTREFGIMKGLTNPPLFWCAWYGVQVVLNILTQVSKLRFDHLSVNPSTRLQVLLKLLGLLGFTIIADTCWIYLAFAAFPRENLASLFIMTFSGFTAILDVLELSCKLVAHMVDSWFSDRSRHGEYAPMYHMSSVIYSMFRQFGNVSHCLHIVYASNFSLSILNTFAVLKLRSIVQDIIEHIKGVRNYLWVMDALRSKFENATEFELQQMKGDVCAICLCPMSSAKKLPCSHFFHLSCLQQCFERRPTTEHRCPICRKPVDVHKKPDTVPNESAPELPTAETPPQPQANTPPQENRPRAQDERPVFRFSSEVLPDWIPVPPFSFEIVRRSSDPERVNPQASASSAASTAPPPPGIPAPVFLPSEDALVQQVLNIFPQYNPMAIRADLRRTRSAEITIENILLGNLVTSIDSPETVPVPSPSRHQAITSPPIQPDTLRNPPHRGPYPEGNAAPSSTWFRNMLDTYTSPTPPRPSLRRFGPGSDVGVDHVNTVDAEHDPSVRRNEGVHYRRVIDRTSPHS